MTLHLDISTGGATTTNVAGALRRDMPTGGPKFTVKAEEGAVGGSDVYVDDTAGTLNIVGLRRWWAWESGEDAGNQVIATGYLGPREIGRIANGVEDHVVGADRCWTVTLNDANQLLYRRLITGSDGDRPAETDIARITWLLASGYLSSVDNTLGYINSSDTTSMDAADLRGQSAYEVLRDCAQRSGKDFYLVRRGDTSPPTFGGTDAYSLFYDYQYSGTYQSSLRLTNIRADVDNSVTFAVHPDAKLRRTPDRTYSGLYVRHVNGAYYTQNVTTANTYGARDNAVSNSNVSSDSAAAALASTYLDNARSEEDRITCRFLVPHTKVNHLREGQAVQVKMSHFGSPYSDGYVWCRCVERSVEHLSDEWYEITVELVGLGVTTYTSVQLQRPNSSVAGDANGTFAVRWSNDGDAAGSGCSTSPKVGLADYAGSGGARTGVTMQGTGLVSIDCVMDCGGVAGDTITMICTVTKNGATIYSQSYTDSTPGLHTIAFSPSITLTNIAVRPGDVIAATWTNSKTPNIFVIPSGVGNCAHMLYVRGYLR